MYSKKPHIHFVGIGGIGMSGIAIILKQQGYTISGCDAHTNQETVTQLRALGCAVYQDNNNYACDDATINKLVYIPMYATTIDAVTTEITRARTNGIPTVSRAQMLAELMLTKHSIAVAGSHGKTTTTSLIAHILIEAGIDPMVIVGGHVKNMGSNARNGNGDFLVAEADESDRSFLQLNPTYAIITNIDLEHLETYTDLDDIKTSFKQFLNNLHTDGKAIICIDDVNIGSLLPLANVTTISYGINHNADLYAQDITLNADHSLFTVYTKSSDIPFGTITLPMPGLHNIYNALAAIAMTLEMKIDFTTITNSLISFAGIDRRFSFHGTYNNAEIFDDYGHHPKEIENTLIIARKRAINRLTVVFQPHRHTRTEKLWADFLTTFRTSSIDTLIITDIYSAGEQPINTISSERMAQELQSFNPPFTVLYIPFDADFHRIKQAITRSTQPNDLILLLGAGKTQQIAQELAE